MKPNVKSDKMTVTLTRLDYDKVRAPSDQILSLLVYYYVLAGTTFADVDHQRGTTFLNLYSDDLSFGFDQMFGFRFVNPFGQDYCFTTRNFD